MCAASNPKAIGDILSQLKQTTKLGGQLEQARIWERWPEVAGRHLSRHGAPKAIKDGTLHVEVDSPVWMHRLAYEKWDLVGRINRMAGRELVSDVFIVLRDEEDPDGSGDS